MTRLQRFTTWVVLGAFTLLTACLPGLHTCGGGARHVSCARAAKAFRVADLHAPRDLRMDLPGLPAVKASCVRPAAEDSECLACSFFRANHADGAAASVDFLGIAPAETLAVMPDSPALAPILSASSPRAPPANVSL